MNGSGPGRVSGRCTGGYPAAVAAWVEHLRAGGTTPWTDWAAGDGRPSSVLPQDRLDEVPVGAAECEFVRRLAVSARDHADDDADRSAEEFASLADLVLSRSGPGRGRPAQPLPWPGPVDGSAVSSVPTGPPALDPADVPDAELIRVGCGVLAELLIASGPRGPAAGSPAMPRRPLLTRVPAFRIEGAAVTTARLRRRLADRGVVEGGLSPLVLLVGHGLDAMLAQAWSARVQRGSQARWPGFVARWSGRDRLPSSADLPRIAKRWTERVGAGNVHLMVRAGPPAGEVAGLLGIAPESGGAWSGLAPAYRDLSPAEVDVVRRVNAVLAVRTGPEHAAGLRRTLVAELADLLPRRHPPQALGVPPRLQPWARARALRMVEQLGSGGYVVHGDLERIMPRFEQPETRPPGSTVLRLLTLACLDLAGRNEQTLEGEEQRR